MDKKWQVCSENKGSSFLKGELLKNGNETKMYRELVIN